MNTVSRLLAFLLCSILITVVRNEKVDTRVPLIGILMQNGPKEMDIQIPDAYNHYTYVPASYVEWIAQVGAIPVLVPFDVPDERLQAILEEVDGFLLPGGDTDIKDKDQRDTPYQEVTKKIIAHSEKTFNAEGKFFPIFGTCLGFEQIFMKYGTNPILTEGFKDQDVMHPIVLEEDFAQSRLLANFDKDKLKKVFDAGLIYYLHDLGVSYETLQKEEFKKVRDELLILGYSQTGQNHDGVKFVALIEHKKYPIFGVQFHLEYAQFERGPGYEKVDRSQDIFDLSYSVAEAFVDSVRHYGNPKNFEEIPEWLKVHFSHHMLTLPSFYVKNEKVYIQPRLYAEIPDAPLGAPEIPFEETYTGPGLYE